MTDSERCRTLHAARPEAGLFADLDSHISLAFLTRFDAFMLNDKLVSMDNGPVNSITLNMINGLSEAEGWDEFISDRENHLVAVASSEITIGGSTTPLLFF